MPKNTARPDESEWRNIESGEVSDIKDNDSPIEASEIVENFRCFQLDKIFNNSSSKEYFSWFKNLFWKCKIEKSGESIRGKHDFAGIDRRLMWRGSQVA